MDGHDDDAPLPAGDPHPADAQGYVLRVSERTTAAMQLAAHFTERAMAYSTATDPRERLAEQLSYFDLAFRSVMGSTARGVIKAGTDPLSARHGDRAVTGMLG